MRPLALVPRAVMAKKPAHGAPCNSCGACCMATRCDIGLLLFGRGGACPALEPSSDGFGCGVAADPAKHMPEKVKAHGVETIRRAILYIIYAGKGCDARFSGEPIDRDFHARSAADYDAEKSRNALALILL